MEQQHIDYAKLIVEVGLNLRPSQRLLINNAPIHLRPFVHLLAQTAYQAGASYVDTLYLDEDLTLTRYQYGNEASFGNYPAWPAAVLNEYLDYGDAILTLSSQNPDLLRGQDSERIARDQASDQRQRASARARIAQNVSNWCIAAVPNEAWAQKVFPQLSAEQAMASLWQSIFEVCRVNEEDPLAAWQQHLTDLSAHCQRLNDKGYQALHFRNSLGTDLRIELPISHRWHGGSVEAVGGQDFVPNMPTEEVFTLAHKDGVNGRVVASRPLSYGGNIIENFSLDFKDGKVVNVLAEQGQALLEQMVASDEGAGRIGELALVPHSSPISQSNTLFFNTLFDENASCHLALGNAYRFTIDKGIDLDDAAFAEAGGNISESHVDFMFGSADLAVTAYTQDGQEEILMVDGEWN